MGFERSFADKLVKVRVKVNGTPLDLSRLGDDERKEFNVLISKAEVL